MTDVGYGTGAVIQDIAGVRVGIPYQPAAEWVEACAMATDISGVVFQLATRSSVERLNDAMVNSRVTTEELAKGATGLLERVSPYRWWVTYRLFLLSRQAAVMGRIVLAGLDPWKLPPAMWATGVYALLTENASETERFKFDAQLETPPPGVDDDTWGADDFESMVASARAMPGMR
jgi:hypothetical protein